MFNKLEKFPKFQLDFLGKEIDMRINAATEICLERGIIGNKFVWSLVWSLKCF